MLIGNGGLNIHGKFWACSFVTKRVSESPGIVSEFVVFTALSLLLDSCINAGSTSGALLLLLNSICVVCMQEKT